MYILTLSALSAPKHIQHCQHWYTANTVSTVTPANTVSTVTPANTVITVTPANTASTVSTALLPSTLLPYCTYKCMHIRSGGRWIKLLIVTFYRHAIYSLRSFCSVSKPVSDQAQG